MEKLRSRMRLGAVCVLGLIGLGALAVAKSVSAPSSPTAFTYGGRLTEGAVPAEGVYEFQFALFADPEGGQPIAPVVEEQAPVNNGDFSADLDFGRDLSTGDLCFLEIRVRPQGNTGDFAILSPRQECGAPLRAWQGRYALFGGGLSAPGAPSASGAMAEAAPVTAQAALAATGDWNLNGNAGTDPGANFLGTTDNTALSLRVNGQRALRLEPMAGSPNVIGGFQDNSVTAGIKGATIGGGGAASSANTVTGDFGTVAGGRSNRATGSDSTVGGGRDNTASGEQATAAGGWRNISSGWLSTVGGGVSGTASGMMSTIAGGYVNVAGGPYAAVGGGSNNAAQGLSSTIGGGNENTISADTSTISGGYKNSVTAEHSVVAGGAANVAGGAQSTVSGGVYNTSSGQLASVGGGASNTAKGNVSTVAGGSFNTANGILSAVGGGTYNSAGGDYSAIGGGQNNRAGGLYAATPGGADNSAGGNYAFAAGRRAKAMHSGAFVWADQTNADLFSSRNGQFLARASGGVVFYSNAGMSAGVKLDPGSGSWANVSDRAAKENFSPVNGRQALDKLAAVPIQTWNYKSEDPSVRHVGPSAQDLYAAFGMGPSDKSICTIDADGISLAAIQGLYQIVQTQGQEKDRQIETLRRENAQLKSRLTALERKVTAPADAR